MKQPRGEHHERVLDDVLGQDPVTGDQIREPDAFSGVKSVQVLQARPTGPALLHGGPHHALSPTLYPCGTPRFGCLDVAGFSDAEIERSAGGGEGNTV